MATPATTGNSRPWKCPQCGATLGVVVYDRRKPPELIPRMPVIAIRGGVVWFRCLECEAPIEWRIVSAA
jgi:hypothetical protein